MDGNLLDPDNADATLAKEWSLPELPPEKSSSVPGSSRELAEIFGTSDDEEDIGFPFSLGGVGKNFPDLSIPDGRVSEFFLNSISTLSVPTSIESGGMGGGALEGAGAADRSTVNTTEPGGGGKDVKEGVKEGETPASEEEKGVKVSAGGCDGDNGETGGEGGDAGMKESTDDPSTAEAPEESAESAVKSEGGGEEQKQTTNMTLRKSSRLQRRWGIMDVGERKEVKKEVIEVTKVRAESQGEEEKAAGSEKEKESVTESVPEGDEVDTKERSTKDMNPEPKKLAAKEELPVQPAAAAPTPEIPSDEEEGSESDDDPDRLWCICQQPHNDRFMICCDQCEEWFHGSCVGISVSQGKRMEREGKEYVCPICVEKERLVREQREANRSARIGRRDIVKEKDMKKKVEVTPQPPRRRSSSGAGGEESSDQYGLSQLFQPDNVPKGAHPEGEDNTTVRTKFKEEYTGTCIAPDCGRPTIPPSVFCGEACVDKHASHSIRKLSERGITFQHSPHEFVRGSGGVSVIEKATGKMLVGIAAPSEKNLATWLKEHPSFQVLLHKKTKDKSKKPKKPGVKKEDSSSSFPKIALMDPSSVRANAKRALYQILWKRCEDSADMKDLEQSRVEATANEIEEKLFNLNQDINPKYKNKYRSLVFNLKDTKNQGLFRKVVTSQITPYELVRMTTEKLASEELAQWRENTIKKNIEMIKVREEEMGTAGKVIRKFTYKGEVEIDTADDSKIEPMDVTEGSTPATSEELTSATIKSEPGSKPAGSKKSHSDSKKSTGGGGGGGILDLLSDGGGSISSSSATNTTAQHGSHVYDQHCDICTNKATSPPPPPPPPPPQPSSPPSQLSPSSLPDNMEVEPSASPAVTEEYIEPEVPQMSANQVIWKGFVNMSGLAKFVTTAYPVSGPAQNIDELLPDTLHVMGRIAHVQVWDYMDKLRSSTTRDIVLLRFGCVDEELDSYNSMLTYLVKKHRCGVINCCYPGMKDMYLVPLQAAAPIAPQLLPFNGPGLPLDRPDLLLGVIVRSKVQYASTPAITDPKSPLGTQKISAEVCIKRHHSLSVEDAEEPPAKKSRMTVEVGVRGETPPRVSGFQDSEYQDTSTTPTFKDSSGGVGVAGVGSEAWALVGGGNSLVKLRPEKEVVKEEPKSSVANQDAQKVQMSFYGEHRPLPEPSPPEARSISKLPPPVAAPLMIKTQSPAKAAPVALPADDNLSSILSKISDEKLLKDLASAVSTLTSKSVPHSSPASSLAPAPGASARRVPDYGANTPPPEDVLSPRKHPPQPLPSTVDKLPRVAGGPPFPGQQVDATAAVPGNQFAPLPSAAPVQNTNQSRDTEWHRDRERFANTPPPEFQSSFTYPPQQQAQQQQTQQQAYQQQQPQASQQQQAYQQHEYHNNYPPNRGGHNIYQQQQPQPPQHQAPVQQTPQQNYYESTNTYLPTQQQQPPQQQYGATGYQPQRDPREYRQDHTHYGGGDPRLRDQSHDRERGYQQQQRGGGGGRGYRGGFRGHRGGGGGGDRGKYHGNRGRGDRKYPKEWYRN